MGVNHGVNIAQVIGIVHCKWFPDSMKSLHMEFGSLMCPYWVQCTHKEMRWESFLNGIKIIVGLYICLIGYWCNALK